MKCTECGGNLLKSRGDHEYNAGIKGVTVTLLDIEHLECAKCGRKSFEIQRIGQLHRDLEAAATTRKHHGKHVKRCQWLISMS